MIIPVYNEGKRICDALAPFLILSGSHVEVIVVDGSPDAGTIRHIEARDRILCIRSEKGRGVQMNAGALRSRGDILLFLHSDSSLPDGWNEDILAALSDKDISGGAFALEIDSHHWFLKMVSFLTSLRSRINRIPYGDQAIFVRKNVFDELGGFETVPIMEDVLLMRTLKRRKKRIMILPKRVITSARRWKKDGILFTTLRNRVLIILFILGVPLRKLAYFYHFRKS